MTNQQAREIVSLSCKTFYLCNTSEPGTVVVTAWGRDVFRVRSNFAGTGVSINYRTSHHDSNATCLTITF